MGVIQQLFILNVLSRTECLFHVSSEPHFSRSVQTDWAGPSPQPLLTLYPLPGMPCLVPSFQPNRIDSSKPSLGPSRKSSR